MAEWGGGLSLCNSSETEGVIEIHKKRKAGLEIAEGSAGSAFVFRSKLKGLGK